MKRKQAITECKRQARSMSFAIGDFHVIKDGDEYDVVSGSYIEMYKPDAEVIYTHEVKESISTNIKNLANEAMFSIKSVYEEKKKKKQNQ